MAEQNSSIETEIEQKLLQSVCVLRLSAIGDVCNALAVVQEIQRQRPNCSLTWVVGRAEFALLKNVSGIEFIVYDKKTGFKGLFSLWRHLRKRRFDALLHMQTAFRASLVSLCINAERRIGFDKVRAREMQPLFCNESISPSTKPHVLDGFIAFARQLGLSPFDPQWDFPLEDEVQHWAHSKTAGKPYVVISPCASNPERNWPIEHYAQIADYLHSQSFIIALTAGGQSEDLQFARNIETACTSPLINLAGATNLQQVLALIKHASFVLSPDSGPLHMSVMLGTPVVGLYAHSNPQRTGPWRFREFCISHYEKNIEEHYGKRADLLPWGKRVKGSHLMARISIEEVKEKIKSLILTLK